MAYKNNQSGITIGGYVPQRIPVRSNYKRYWSIKT